MKPQPAPKPRDIPVLRWLAGDNCLEVVMGEVDKAATIWKFPFEVSSVVAIEMPGIPHILHIECQHGTPCIWAVVNPADEKVIRRFRLLRTGHPISGRVGRYVGTFQDGPFVWHAFEETV